MGDSYQTAAPVDSKIRKCFRRLLRVMSLDRLPAGRQRAAIRPLAKSLSAVDLAGAAAAASQQESSLRVRSDPSPRRPSGRLVDVPYYLPNAAGPSSANTQTQQLLPQWSGAQHVEPQLQPRKQRFSPGTMTALQQVLVVVPALVPAETATCSGSGSRCSSSSAPVLADQPAAAISVARSSSTSSSAAAPLTQTAAAPSAAAAAAAVKHVSSESSCESGYQQQTDDSATCQSPNSLQQQLQFCEIVPDAWLCSLPVSTAADAVQMQDCPNSEQRKRRSTELVAVRWLRDVPYPCSIPCSVLDGVQLELGRPDTPMDGSATAAVWNSSEQKRWHCWEHSSSTVLFAVPAATSGELDSLAVVPLVNPYSAKAAAVKGGSSWQGWQSGHTPHLVQASVNWE